MSYQQRLAALSLTLLSLIGSRPAPALEVNNFECSFKGSYGSKAKPQQHPLAFKGFLYYSNEGEDSAWSFRANSTQGNPARIRGYCDEEIGCTITHKANGKIIYFEFGVVDSSQDDEVLTEVYAGSWDPLPVEVDEGPFNMTATCRPAKVQAQDAFESIMDKALGWSSETF